MIRVRYRDFRTGSYGETWLYGSAERHARGVTVYLLPGLAGWQRKAVIRRLRQEASRGCGPELPLAELVIALSVDRVRQAVGVAASAVRLHPAVTLLPGAAGVAAMTLFVLASAGSGAPETSVPRSGEVPGIASGVRFQGAATDPVPMGVDSLARGLGGTGTGLGPRAARAALAPAGRGVCRGQLPSVALSASQLACRLVAS